MPSLAVYAKELDPYIPAIDSRRQQKPGIIDGTNFLDGMDGPYSAFSNDFWNWMSFDATTGARVTELQVGGQIFYGTPTGIWRINPTTLNGELLLPITVTNTFWPWTVALVGGLYYFAQYDIGLWQYDDVNNIMKHIVTPAGDTVRGVTLSYSRLIYLTDTAVAWSSVDDGTDLNPSLTTGAGAQALTMVGGIAYGLFAVSDGFIVVSSRGGLKATYIWYANYIFQFKVIGKNDIRAFSPNMQAIVPGIGLVILDGAGFHVTNGNDPEDWQPQMGEFLKLNYIENLNKGKFGTSFMYYSQAMRILFVGFGPATTEGLISTTFALYIPTQRWGVFSNTHRGIFEVVQVINSVNAGAYMAVDGYIRRFTNTDFTEDIPPQGYKLQDYVFRQVAEIIVEDFTDAASVRRDVGYSEFNFSDIIPTAYTLAQSEVFVVNTDTTLSDTATLAYGDPSWSFGAPYIGGTYCDFISSGGAELRALVYELPEVGLNSYLKLGPFRYVQQEQVDETSNITSLLIGIASVTNFTTTEDYNTEDVSEDWSLGADTFEDWGSGIANPNSFTLELVDSNDGVNPQFQGVDTLNVMQNNGASLSYNPTGYASIYHFLNIRARNPQESFAIKVVEMAGALTGRLV